MIVLSDVLEHFADIEGLFEMSWDYAFISYPETPKVNTQEELEEWKHFKPNEHIWCLNLDGMVKWINGNGFPGTPVTMTRNRGLSRKSGPTACMVIRWTSLLVGMPGWMRRRRGLAI